ncbi:failed axon connections [Cladorrhinum sp. PSN332]|nr:failed axon connections [Cladorrhinum sp. PSN332]
MSHPKPSPSITLHRGFPATRNHVWSPFVNKLELRLRLDKTPYTLAVGTPRQAPLGKIPYISTSLCSEKLLGDTTLITKHLIDSEILTELNANLTPAKKAQDLAVRSLLEDKLYFYLVRERWMDNYYVMRDGVLGGIPFPLRVVVGNLAYRSVKSALWGQGTGRYTEQEVRRMREEVWEGLSGLLAEVRREGDRPFWVLGGDEPTEADATVYGFVVGGLICSAGPETQKTVRSFPILVEYARRIREAYFSDYDLWEKA